MKKLMYFLLCFLPQIINTSQRLTDTPHRYDTSATVYIPISQNKRFIELQKLLAACPTQTGKQAIQKQINQEFPTYAQPISKIEELKAQRNFIQQQLKTLSKVVYDNDPRLLFTNNKGIHYDDQTSYAIITTGESDLMVIHHSLEPQVHAQKKSLEKQETYLTEQIAILSPLQGFANAAPYVPRWMMR